MNVVRATIYYPSRVKIPCISTYYMRFTARRKLDSYCVNIEKSKKLKCFLLLTIFVNYWHLSYQNNDIYYFIDLAAKEKYIDPQYLHMI